MISGITFLADDAPKLAEPVASGWQLILANNKTGVLNWVLLSLGIIHQPIQVLYSETAVVIGSLHVFFPMMVLPLASALAKQPGTGGRRPHPRRAVLEGVLAHQPAAQPARPRRRLHPGILIDREFLRHPCHTRRHPCPNAGQPHRAADRRRL